MVNIQVVMEDYDGVLNKSKYYIYEYLGGSEFKFIDATRWSFLISSIIDSHKK